MRHDPRPLLWAGVVVGVGFEAKPQVAVVAVVALVALALVGPRWLFRSRQLWAGVVIAAVLGAPYLIWQQRHGWPQLTVAGNIAGNAEDGRAGFIPFQIVMVCPLLVPVWIAGLVTALRRTRRCGRCGFVPVLFGLLAAAYLIGDGKAYYLASLYPTLIGIGAIATDEWLARGRAQRRLAWLGSPSRSRRSSAPSSRCRSCRRASCPAAAASRSTPTSARRSAGRSSSPP